MMCIQSDDTVLYFCILKLMTVSRLCDPFCQWQYKHLQFEVQGVATFYLSADCRLCFAENTDADKLQPALLFKY